MADSTVVDLNKWKVVDLRKDLKSRGLPTTGDKAELVARLQSAMSQDEHGDINLDSDEIDSDGVLEDDDDKSQTDILDDPAVASLNEELALSEKALKPASNTKPVRTLKRKITSESASKTDDKTEETTKKIVLNRAASLTALVKLTDDENQSTKEIEAPTETSKVVITADVDPKTKLELRAKRFGLPIKMDDDEKKVARMRRFGQKNTSNAAPIGNQNLTENLEKLKKRAERFGQSVSKVMTVIENKEKLEKRKAKFGTT